MCFTLLKRNIHWNVFVYNIVSSNVSLFSPQACSIFSWTCLCIRPKHCVNFVLQNIMKTIENSFFLSAWSNKNWTNARIRLNSTATDSVCIKHESFFFTKLHSSKLGRCAIHECTLYTNNYLSRDSPRRR